MVVRENPDEKKKKNIRKQTIFRKHIKPLPFFSIALQNERVYQSTLSNPAVLELKKRKVLVGMCKTRWSEHDMSYEHFYLAILSTVEAFEIMNGTYPKNNDFNSIYKDG